MYITIGKLVYPKADNIKVARQDIVDKDDREEHNIYVSIYDVNVLALTQNEAMTLIDKLSFALQDKEGK